MITDNSIESSINDILIELEDDGFTGTIDCCYNKKWLSDNEQNGFNKYGLFVNIHKWKLKNIY